MLCIAKILKPDEHHNHLQSLWSIQTSGLLPRWFWGLSRSYPKDNRIAFAWSFWIRHEVFGIHADERLDHEIFELFWIRQRGKSFITPFNILWHFIIHECSKCRYFANPLHPAFEVFLDSGCNLVTDQSLQNSISRFQIWQHPTWGKCYYKATLNCQKSVCLQ